MTPSQIRKLANNAADFALQPTELRVRDDIRSDAALKLLGEFVAQMAELNERLYTALLHVSTERRRKAK